MPPPRAVSFSGGGHLLVYHLGVLSRLRSVRGSSIIHCYAGSSGGAIAAAAATCIEDIDRFTTEFAIKGQSRRGLELMLPSGDSDIGRLTANSRLGVSVTRCETGENVLIREFKSKEDLLMAVHASCLIPRSFHPLDFFSFTKRQRSQAQGRFACHEGVQLAGMEGSFVDGGLSANIPEVPLHETLRVSVLACPEDGLLIANNHHCDTLRLPGSVYMTGLPVRLSASNLRAGLAAVAGTRRELQHYYERGRIDCDKFLAADRSFL